MESRWRLESRFRIVLKIWSFNLVLTVVDPVPPKPQVGLGLIGPGVVGTEGKGRQSCSPSVEINRPDIFGELTGVGATLCRVVCLDNGLGCGQNLGSTPRSGVEAVASPNLRLVIAANPTPGVK